MCDIEVKLMHTIGRIGNIYIKVYEKLLMFTDADICKCRKAGTLDLST